CFDIAPGAFMPPPEVVSTVVHIHLEREPRGNLTNEAAFWRVVRAAFSQRRKTLGNTLRQVASREQLAGAFAELNLDPQRRGETLTLEEYTRLAETLFPAGTRPNA